MSLKLTLISVDTPSNKASVDAIFQIVASGTFPSGGDTLDLTQLIGQFGTADGGTLDADLVNRLPQEAYASSQNFRIHWRSSWRLLPNRALYGWKSAGCAEAECLQAARVRGGRHRDFGHLHLFGDCERLHRRSRSLPA